MFDFIVFEYCFDDVDEVIVVVLIGGDLYVCDDYFLDVVVYEIVEFID